MSSQDRKTPLLDPDRATAAADAGGRQGPMPGQANPQPVSDDESVAPLGPANGALLEGGHVDVAGSDANEIEPSMAANADIEHVPETAPEQIDPGSDGKPVI